MVRASVSIVGSLLVAGVEFRRDGGNVIGSDGSSPYEVSWNTASTGNGWHTLTAVARDTLGGSWPSNQVSVQVANGPPPDTTPPTVSITAPAGGTTVGGMVLVRASASDNVGVSGVQFKLDGANLGGEDTTSPYEVSWNTTQVGNGSHTLTAVARDAAGNRTTSAAVGVTVFNDTTPPTVSITAPAEGTTVSGTVLVRASASDDVGVVGVQFKLDGYNLGGEDTSSPYEVSWNTTQVGNGSHTLTAVARDAVGNQTTSAPVTVTVSNAPPDTTPPTVTVTEPGSGATVSGTLTVRASASDNVGVAGVQFFVDGSPLGAEDTAAPYDVIWDTTTAGDGSHSLTARARDAAGNTATSAPVGVTVSNGSPGPTPTRFEETAATLAPAGAWIAFSSAVAGFPLSGDRAVDANVAGATATFTFTGTGVSWIGARCEICGIARVYLDGALVATVDTFDPARSATVLFARTGLAAASHTLVIEVTGTKNAASGDAWVAVDAFDVTDSAVPPPTADTTAPTVAITSPGSGATVSGTIAVTASASDNVGVAAVEFLLDGVAGAEDVAAPYAVTWDTTTAGDGSHTLTARARDAAGNVGTSSPVTVTVSNAAAPPTGARFEAETAATLLPVAAWFGISSADAGATLSGGLAIAASEAGATATFTFTGTGVSWLGLRCEMCGIARVLLDGAPVATVDTYAPTRSAAVLFTRTGLAAGTHMLVIEVTGTQNASSAGAFVVVDAFDVIP